MAGMYGATRRTADDVTERASMSPYDIHAKEKYELREYLIAVEQIKMMQEKLKVCYLKSGPNHFEDCKELREKLWTKMNTHNYGAPGPARSVRACLISRARSVCKRSSPCP
jgi:hypothetical protein